MKTEIATKSRSNRLLDWSQSYFLRKIAGLRIEEFIAYLFFIPCLAITLRANSFFWLQDLGMGHKIVAGFWRILIVTALLPAIPYLAHRSDSSRFHSVL